MNNWKKKQNREYVARVIIALLVLTLVWISEPLTHKSKQKECLQQGNDNIVSTIPATKEMLQQNIQEKEEESSKKTLPPSQTPCAEETLSKTNGFGKNHEAVKVKGIYVTGPIAGTKKQMDELISLVKSTELNAMVIDIKNDSGEITYKMDYPFAKKIGATKNYISDMEGLVKKLKENDIYLIGRIVTFKDPILASNREDLSVLNKDGTVFRDKKGLAWVNPYKKKVWNYNLHIALKAAKMGFDEIQFDYIRFSTDNGMKNVTLGKEALSISRQEAITNFTEYAHKVLGNKGIKVSADVYGTIISSEGDSQIVGQNYSEMANHLDYICPMIYPSQYAKGSYGIKNPDASPYDIIYNALTDSRQRLKKSSNDCATVRPWLQDFSATWIDGHITYGKKQLKQQIKAVYDAGYDEWILWNAKNKYTY